MKTKAGMWIDHHTAVIVELTETGEQIRRMQSGAEKQRRRSGEPSAGPFPAKEIRADDSQEREYQGYLARYYDKIISHLLAADEVLIFGPGEAKGELKKRFAKEKCNACVLTLETADKMTDPQIAAHVRQHFEPEASRVKVGNFHRLQTINQG